MLFEEKIKENKQAFISKLIDVASRLQIPPDWLMAIFKSESGVDSHISNVLCVKSTGDPDMCATGLIQFMPSTAARLVYGNSYNYSEDKKNGFAKAKAAIRKLRTMSNVDQLEYVYKYFEPYKDKITRFIDLYLIDFYPYALGKPDDYIFGSERSMEYARKVTQSNPPLDLNKDGYITLGEYKEHTRRRLPPELFNQNDSTKPDIVNDEVSTVVKAEKYTKRNWIPITLVFAGLALLGYVAIKNRDKILKSF